jgi:hypothetical protein
MGGRIDQDKSRCGFGASLPDCEVAVQANTLGDAVEP